MPDGALPDDAPTLMDPALAEFLARQRPRVQFETRWADGRIVLTVTAYLGDDEPPPALITSVRAIVGHPTLPQILVVTDPRAGYIRGASRRSTGR